MHFTSPLSRLLIVVPVIAASACAMSRATLESAMDNQSFPAGMRYDVKARELIIDFPAMDLPANLNYEDGGVTKTMSTVAPFDGWMHGYTIEVVDNTGKVMGNGFLHHTNILGPGQRELFEPIMIHIVASGMETAEVRTPRRIGYPLHRGDKLMLVAMLHNPTDTARTGMRVRARLPMTIASSASRSVVSVYPFHLQVTEPGRMAEFDLPQGRSVQVREARPAIAGRIYAVGGHLHQHGVSVTFEDVTANKILYAASAMRDAYGNVTSIPTRRFPGKGVRVEPGHVYRITSVYENSSGATIAAGGMGSIGGVFIPDRRATWPAVDTANEVYMRDYAMRFAPAAVHIHR